MDLFETLSFAEILGQTTFLDTLSLTVLIFEYIWGIFKEYLENMSNVPSSRLV